MQQLSQNTSQILDETSTEISTYVGDILDTKTVVNEIAKIRIVFPSLTPQFADVLIERAIAKGFTSKRFVDAVNHVIDNCQYPNPTLANFLSFDKRIKVFTYNELVDLVSSNRADFSNYHRYVINSKSLYIRKVDKELYGMPEQLL